jgi:hypothetical protein
VATVDFQISMGSSTARLMSLILRLILAILESTRLACTCRLYKEMMARRCTGKGGGEGRDGSGSGGGDVGLVGGNSLERGSDSLNP